MGIGEKVWGGAGRFAVRDPRVFALAPRRSSQGGWTLIELVITMTVLTILSLGVIPMVKTAVKRQREQQLRDSLREMRDAINDFHRDALNSPYLDQLPPGTPQAVVPIQPNQPNQPPPPGGAAVSVDPRTKVAIADKTLFGVDNPDRFPPKLETLVEGVSVAPRVQPIGGDINKNILDQQGPLAFKKKVYLRKIPVDPMTGKADWGMRSCYDSPDSNSWGGENVFDVYSKSQDTALNGQKYSDW
ncbi:MAG TPA: type II secretion system protein [Pyrinomonadaceae bacterium]|jgi:general secretion pathway protein G|nr:type II secretion system protein [Pyrinomonadaceae bacterium]